MTRRINRNDPAYEQAMREAKALFDAAMQKSAMKGRGRPAAAAAAAAPVVAAEAPMTDADLEREIGDDMPPEAKAAVAAPASPAAPAAPAAPQKAAPAKTARSAKTARAATPEPAAPPEKKRVVRRPKKEPG